MKAVASVVLGVLALAVFSAHSAQEQTINGLNRHHLADAVVCLGRTTSFIGHALLAIGEEKPEPGGLLKRALEANARLPEQFRETPEAVEANLKELLDTQSTSLASYGGQHMRQCVLRQGIPLNPTMSARCYEVISFLNAMRATLGKQQTPEAFADTWVPQIARSPEDAKQLRPAVIEQFGTGALPPREELILYLRCAMPKSDAAK